MSSDRRQAPLRPVPSPGWVGAAHRAPEEELGPSASDEGLADLLEKTSRTFALAIPLLPQPTRREVGIAYLLFRIADTFEDATVAWSRPRQIAALRDFGRLLEAPSRAGAEALAAEWLAEPPTSHAGYRELLAQVPAVLAAFAALAQEPREIVRVHTRRTAEGMAGFVARTGGAGGLELADVADLKAYCHTVAGIVGEMLTELFLLRRPHLTPIAGFLRHRATRFGEGLQLVNILKDSAGDVTEGRRYLPPGVPRSELFALAHRDLDAAAEYVLAIQDCGGPAGLAAFTALPVELARASLDRIEAAGPGSKITRAEVAEIHRRLNENLAAGRAALPRQHQ